MRHRRNLFFATVVTTSLVVLVSGAHAQIGGLATAIGDRPIKTFPLSGIKDSPPYLHDGQLLALENTVEFFNLVLGTQLTPAEEKDLVAFLRAL